MDAGGLVNLGARTIAVAACLTITATVGACGQRADLSTRAAPAAAVVAAIAAEPVLAPQSQPIDSIPAVAAPLPNAQGDPPCPAPHAWGRHPHGLGILVTYWSDAAAAVTILVRTTTGADRAQRRSLRADELHLFEFPDIEPALVHEVLVMTNTLRCFALLDPAAKGS